MAYADLAKAWTRKDIALMNQIAGACLSCAADIAVEGGTVPNHAARIQWALKVKDAPHVEAKKFLMAICMDATIAAALPDALDADIKAVIVSKIDEVA